MSYCMTCAFVSKTILIRVNFRDYSSKYSPIPRSIDAEHTHLSTTLGVLRSDLWALRVTDPCSIAP
jgi:hypothetical protein